MNGNAVVTAQWTATSYTGKTHTDVNKSDWFYNYVMELSEQGIVGGNGDGTFAPTVPRARAKCSSSCCSRPAMIEQKPSTAHWASGYATYAYSMGLPRRITATISLTTASVALMWRACGQGAGLWRIQHDFPLPT